MIEITGVGRVTETIGVGGFARIGVRTIHELAKIERIKRVGGVSGLCRIAGVEGGGGREPSGRIGRGTEVTGVEA